MAIWVLFAETQTLCLYGYCIIAVCLFPVENNHGCSSLLASKGSHIWLCQCRYDVATFVLLVGSSRDLTLQNCRERRPAFLLVWIFRKMWGIVSNHSFFIVFVGAGFTSAHLGVESDKRDLSVLLSANYTKLTTRLGEEPDEHK